MRTLKDRQNLNEREILRYLGYKSGQEVDARTLQLIAQEEEELFRTAEFRSVYRIFPIRQVTEDAVDFGFTCIHSRNLAKNLKGCGQAAFLAATLGSGVEHLLWKYNRLQVSRAVVLQAVSVEAIEEYCDACEEEILAALSSGGEGPYYLRPRFSPGYGDLPLEFQREFLQILETPKKIGVTLTDSLLMMPSKSVTAIIGISREDSHCIRQGCESCAHTDCAYRRS